MIKKGRKTKTLIKLNEKFDANCEKEMNTRFRRCAAIRRDGPPTSFLQVPSSAYAGDHGLGRGGMRSSGWGLSGDAVGLLRRISLPGG
jgi:hypothetical protein